MMSTTTMRTVILVARRARIAGRSYHAPADAPFRLPAVAPPARRALSATGSPSPSSRRRRGGSPACWLPSRAPAVTKCEYDRGSAAFFGIAPDPAAELFADESHPIEAEAAPPGLHREHVVRAIELLEEPALGIPRHPD